jgi:hypothetical protein
MNDQIEIKIEATELTPEKFMEAVQTFFVLIQGVAKNLTNDPIHWKVEVDKGSAVVRARVINRTDSSDRCIDAICLGVRSLGAGVKTIPRGFTKREVLASKVLASLADGNNLQAISIKNGDAPEVFSKEIIPAAESILSGEKDNAFGSVEGKIDSLSDRHIFSCSIFEPLLQREITCYFQKEDVREEAVRAFRKRVLASGLIRYAKEGYPTSIVVDSIRIFPEESELPTIEDIQALFR